MTEVESMESVYVVERITKYRSESKNIAPHFFLNPDDAKDWCEKDHDHDKRWCRFCKTDWDGHVKSYEEDDVYYKYTIRKLPLYQALSTAIQSTKSR